MTNTYNIILSPIKSNKHNRGTQNDTCLIYSCGMSFFFFLNAKTTVKKGKKSTFDYMKIICRRFDLNQFIESTDSGPSS